MYTHNTVQELHALSYSEQAETTFGAVTAGAVVANGQSNLVRIILEQQIYSARLRMFGDIRERLLCCTIKRKIGLRC